MCRLHNTPTLHTARPAAIGAHSPQTIGKQRDAPGAIRPKPADDSIHLTARKDLPPYLLCSRRQHPYVCARLREKDFEWEFGAEDRKHCGTKGPCRATSTLSANSRVPARAHCGKIRPPRNPLHKRRRDTRASPAHAPHSNRQSPRQKPQPDWSWSTRSFRNVNRRRHHVAPGFTP